MGNEPVRTTRQTELGRQLHEAEMAVHIGRNAVTEILAQQPVDVDALAEQRQAIKAARIAIRVVRPQLEAEKIANTPQQQLGWIKWK